MLYLQSTEEQFECHTKFTPKSEVVRMPTRPKKPCRHPGCPNLTDERYCSEHSVDNKRASAHERGYTSKWRRLSKLYLKAHPLCVCANDTAGLPRQRWLTTSYHTVGTNN